MLASLRWLTHGPLRMLVSEMRRFVACTGLACLLLAFASAPASASSKVLVAELGATSISAYGGMAAWSHRSNGRFRLRVAYRGRIRTLEIPGRSVPFDVDVGPLRSGRPVLVYSRCDQEPTSSTYRPFETGLPSWKDARGCDVYRFDPRTGREHRLDGLSSPFASETLPTIWRNRLAYASVAEQPRRARVPQITLASTDGRRTARLGTGAHGRIAGTPEDGIHPGPDSIDLRGTRVLVSWRYYGRSCELDSTTEHPDPTASESLASQQLEFVGRDRRVLAKSCDSRGLFGAFWKLSTPTWLQRNPEGVSTTLTGTGPAQELTSAVISAAADGNDLYVVRRRPGNNVGYEIVQLNAR